MYELVKKILDKSKEEKVDVLVAADMVAAEGMGHTDELKKAKDVIDKHYDTITKLRREKADDVIEELCSYIEAGDTAGIKRIVEETEKR